MKKLITFYSVSFAVMVFSTASLPAQTSGQPSVLPQPIPVAAPAMKQQNTQHNSSTAKPSSTAPKESKATAPAKTSDKKADASPPVDNKIAVSDPGIPTEKSSSKTTATPTDNKNNPKSNTGVSPK